jgi:hypothetical protein
MVLGGSWLHAKVFVHGASVAAMAGPNEVRTKTMQIAARATIRPRTERKKLELHEMRMDECCRGLRKGAIAALARDVGPGRISASMGGMTGWPRPYCRNPKVRLRQ